MENKNMLVEFIKSLHVMTVNNLFQWHKIRTYLDREYNRILENYLVKQVQYNYGYNHTNEIDVDESYMVDVEGSFIYLLNCKTYHKNYYKLYVQNYIDADIREVELSNSKLIEELVRQVKESISSQERTMEKVINIAKERLNTTGNESK